MNRHFRLALDGSRERAKQVMPKFRESLCGHHRRTERKFGACVGLRLRPKAAAIWSTIKIDLSKYVRQHFTVSTTS